MNNTRLRILFLEDNNEDAILVREHLSSEGLVFQFDHVSTETEYSDKLRSGNYDVILSDYNLPGFSGIAALLLSKKINPEIPFICISGTIGEDLAIELMHLGASDYILKNNLSKLPVSITRALQEVREHKSRIEAEISLRESEARFRDIIMSTYDWVWEIDAEGKYCYSSDTIGNILGYTQEEILGKSPFDLMSGEEREKVGLAFSKISREKGIIKDLENWNIHKDGHLVCLLTNGFPVFNGNGDLTGYRGVDKDITDRKLAEEKIRKLSRATEQSPVSIIITDLQGNITYANPTVIKLTGYSLEELSGKNPKLFSSGETLKEDYKNLWKTISSGKEWKGEFLNKKKSGEKYWESASISPILDEKGKMTHYLAVKEDITERKKLTSELIEAKARIEASDTLKTAFLNNISHEVRTPLNGILGFSELLLEPDVQQDEKESYLQILNESSERLINTITNYMDMSLIVSGNMMVRLKKVDTSDIIDKIYGKFLPKCKIKNLDLVKQVPPDAQSFLISDDDLLEKAFSHLMDNAIKFTRNGSIIIGFNLTETEFELFVKDTGSGIDPEAQNSVFQIFVQADVAINRGYEGSGLGLSIAKGIVELMGGKIRMESEKDKGSAFYMTFQRTGEQGSELKKSEKTGQISLKGSPMVLIAEDDESNSSYLRTLLKRTSLNYLLAFNGKEAVEVCRTHPEISLVLMDLKMPVMDGLMATRMIKEFRKELPVIGITAFDISGDKENAFEAGCDEYLTKPVKPDFLISVIKKHLRIEEKTE